MEATLRVGRLSINLMEGLSEVVEDLKTASLMSLKTSKEAVNNGGDFLDLSLRFLEKI